MNLKKKVSFVLKFIDANDILNEVEVDDNSKTATQSYADAAKANNGTGSFKANSIGRLS